MNVQSANQIIQALNRLAEGATLLGQAVEQLAWDGIEDHAGMPGARPIAAAHLEEPSFQAAAEELDQQAEPAKVEPPTPAEPAEPVVGLVELRAFLTELSQKGLTAKVRELITATGASALSEVDPAQYGRILAAAKELADGS